MTGRRPKLAGAPLFDLLNLSGWRPIGIDETPSQYTITIEATSARPSCCGANLNDCVRRYGAPSLYLKGLKIVHVRDIPMHGKLVDLKVKANRYQCRLCGGTWGADLAPHKHPERAMTARLVDHIGRRAVRQTFAEVAREVGVSEGTVRAIFSDYAARKAPPIGSTIKAPVVLGVDDKFVLGAWLTVFTDIKNKTLIEIIQGKKLDALGRAIDKFDDLNRIEVICHDMSGTYRSFSLHDSIDATLVVDKFHVIKKLNDALTAARSALKISVPEDQWTILKRTRKLFLKKGSHEGRTASYLLDSLLEQHPSLALTYDLKERFFGFYACKSRKEAEKYYDDWARQITREVRPYFESILSVMEQKRGSWREYVLNWFDFVEENYTNGYAESLNRTIKEVSSSGKGYTFLVLRQKMLLAQSEGAIKPAKFVRDGHEPRGPNKKQRPRLTAKQKMERRFPKRLRGSGDTIIDPVVVTQPELDLGPKRHFRRKRSKRLKA